MTARSWLLVVASLPVILTQENSVPGNPIRVLSLLGLAPSYRQCFVAPPICPNYNISYYLYTRDNPTSPYILDPSKPDTIRNAKFLPRRPVKFLFHGYTGDHNYSPNNEIRPAYLKYSDVSVVSIDYGPLVRDPCYIWATYNVPLVANCTAQLIDMLVDGGIVPLPDIHIVGFSLGAQVAGYLANFIRSGKLQRITGLDPALPLFIGPASQKLDATDAVFVDVIHTNAGRRGKVEASGHVDFYVNGGTNQPGCGGQDSDGASSCSHVRAPILFAESIHTTVGFWGYRCYSYLTYFLNFCPGWDGVSRLEIMGEYVNHSARGTYFVVTNDSPPYAKGYQKIIENPTRRQPRLPSNSSTPQ